MESEDAVRGGGSSSSIVWKKNALERSFQAGQRYSKLVRKMNKHVPRQWIQGDQTKSFDDKTKDLAYEENVRLNSLISNLAQRSTEFGITMEEADDPSNDFMVDGLVEAAPDDEISEQTSLGGRREDAVMSPNALGSVTIDGFAFRTFPTLESDKEVKAAAIPTSWDVDPEQDEDVKPNVEDMNKILFPTKTTDITKIKGWRNKVFAENDELVVKQESDENCDVNTELVDQSGVKSTWLGFNAERAVNFVEKSPKSTLLSCALTLPYMKAKPVASLQKLQPSKKKPQPYASHSTDGVHNTATLIPLPAMLNPNKKPKTKAEYRRMLEAAQSRENATESVKNPMPIPQQAIVASELQPSNKRGRKPGSNMVSDEPTRKRSLNVTDKRLKANRGKETAEVYVAAKNNLDLRFMYAMVNGRAIKIGGSVRAKQIADAKKMEAVRLTRLPLQNPINSRYSGLLLSSTTPTPPSPAPPTKRKNIGRPLSKKLEAKAKRLQEFCLRLHPAIGFPLTDAAFQQIELLRNDKMEINDDWIKFATSVVSTKRPKSYVRKGFVDCITTAEDILLPVKITSSGRSYKPGDLENFNTINVPVSEMQEKPDPYSKDDDNTEDTGGTTTEIRSLLRYMVDSVAKQATIEDLHLLPEPTSNKEYPIEPHEFLNPVRGGPHPRKRRSALNKELRRLNVLMIEERDVEESAAVAAEPVDVPVCRQEHCKFGCLCLSLERSAVEASHCGRAECMFECACGRSVLADEQNVLPKSVVTKINESSKYLAKKEKEFQRTVVCNKNEMLVVDGCAAPATGRRKREVKLPMRFRESGIDDKALFGGNANLEVVEARKKFEESIGEDTSDAINDVINEVVSKGKASPSPEPTEKKSLGRADQVFYVPNHLQHGGFYRCRTENRIAERENARRYRLKASSVKMYRAALDNVTPFCIIHGEYACPCPDMFGLVRRGHGGNFYRRVGVRRNVAVKRTAPRLMPTLASVDRCSRTEGVDRKFIVRNRTTIYKTLEARRKESRARLFANDRSAVIRGSQILAGNVAVGEVEPETEETIIEEPIGDETIASTVGVAPSLICAENFAFVNRSLLNPTQIVPSNFKPRKPKGGATAAKDGATAAKGSATAAKAPMSAETRLMRWSLLQDSFLNNSLQMWLSSPETGTPKLYVSSNLKAPDLKCRNLRNWTGKTERGYPPLVAELMQQIPDESTADKIRYGVLLKRKNHWEVIGIRRLPPASAAKSPGVGEELKFLKANAVMSVPLPAVRSSCRWHVVFLTGHFDRIVFQGCVIVEKNIFALTDGAKRTNNVNAILFKENFPSEFRSLGLPPMFGLYALPKIGQCVFLGPFGLASGKADAIKMFKDVTDQSRCKQMSKTGRIFVEVERPAGKSAWLYAEGLSKAAAENYNAALRRNMPVPATSTPLQSGGVKPRPLQGGGVAVAAKHGQKRAADVTKVAERAAVGGSTPTAVSVTDKRTLPSDIAPQFSSTTSKIPERIPNLVIFENGSSIGRKPPVPILKATTNDAVRHPSSILLVNCPGPVAATWEEIVEIRSPARGEEPPATNAPPPLGATQRRLSAAGSARSRTPSVDCSTSTSSPSPGRPGSAASATSASGARSVLNRPGLTITGLTSVLKTSAGARPDSLLSQLTEITVSDDDDDVEIVSIDDGGVEVTVVPAWRPGPVVADSIDDYELAEANTVNEVSEMFAAAIEGSKRIKYIPSIPSLGYVEAYRLADNRTRIRFLAKAFIEVTFANDAIHQFLDKSIRKNDLLRVEPPDLPLTWELSEDMDSHPDVLPFNYAQTFDGNHMLCEKGLLRKKVPNVDPERIRRDQDIDALLHLKKVLGIPHIDGVSLEEVFNQAGAAIFQCKRQQEELLHRCKWYLRRRRRHTKRLRRLLLEMPDDAERKSLQVSINDTVNKFPPIVAAACADEDNEVVELPIGAEDQGPAKDLWLNNETIDISELAVSLSAYTPRRLKALLFPANMHAPTESPPADKPKYYAEKKALLDSVQHPRSLPRPAPPFGPPTLASVSAPGSSRSAGQPSMAPPPDSLLQQNPEKSTAAAAKQTARQQGLIPFLDLTDDDAAPTVVMKRRPPLPVVTLDDDDDDEDVAPPKKRPLLANKLAKQRGPGGEESPVFYSYGINGAGHYFRCAIINNVIVNKVRISKLPANVECLKIVERPISTLSRRRAGVISGTVVRGTNNFGVRLSPGKLVRCQTDGTGVNTFGQGSSNAQPIVGQLLASPPKSDGLKAVTVTAGAGQPAASPPQCGGIIAVAIPSGVCQTAGTTSNIGKLMGVTVPTDAVQPTGSPPKSCGIKGVTVPNAVGQTVRTPPKIHELMAVTVPSGAGQPVGNPPKFGEIMSAATSNGVGQTAETVQQSGEQNLQNVKKVFRKLISTGNLTGNTRQVMIKGPLIPISKPSIATHSVFKPQRSFIKLQRMQEVTANTSKMAPTSPPGRLVSTQKHFVKISQEELQKMKTVIMKGKDGKFVQLQLKSPPPLVKINFESQTKYPEGQSESIAATDLEVQTEPTTLTGGQKQSIAAIDDEDCSETLVINVEGDEETPDIDKGNNSDSILQILVQADLEVQTEPTTLTGGQKQSIAAIDDEDCSEALVINVEGDEETPDIDKGNNSDSIAAIDVEDCSETLVIDLEGDEDLPDIDKGNNSDSGSDVEHSESVVTVNEGNPEIMVQVSADANAELVDDLNVDNPKPSTDASKPFAGTFEEEGAAIADQSETVVNMETGDSLEAMVVDDTT